jgi:hypothetical protein
MTLANMRENGVRAVTAPPLVLTSWWSGGDSNRMPLADAFASMRHFSIERDALAVVCHPAR